MSATSPAPAAPAAAVPLTHYSPGGGCACKLPQTLLDDVVNSLRGTGATGPVAVGPESGAVTATGAVLRVGLDPADDAAVVDLPGWEGRSLVVTCDFLTPVVDDPFAWGQIAATNALSDVYAMGGRPLVALNLLGWPADLDQSLLAEVLRGGATAVREAGALVVGGHSIVDAAPKYGLAVVGEVDQNAILRKGGGQAGDLLVLTKPLGVGVVTTAVKRGRAPAAVVAEAVAVMTRANAAASRVAVGAGLRGGTDVTGYGLIGHLHEMARTAGVAAAAWPRAVPVLDGVRELVEAGCAPDGSRRTLASALATGWFVPTGTDATTQLLLADAQTSGGLLLAVAPNKADGLLTQLRERGERAAVIGRLRSGVAGQITTENPVAYPPVSAGRPGQVGS
ncbi:selenide, water dikinase SelD [Pseudonocardia alni]|uniref:selenide, water dikinase SelD n=1 Tax=Pseudonocardia TaxID=1847 RepID=UPI000911AD29|nr:selenide, water dikinase SelD [Pseudonocardia sp. SID8383]MYW75163.1 selenide, water dikinase SelD [Pseudonocardia sp. SID8383]OJG04147.1 Selenide, water dikinase [Pseudonocardia autotrophica]